MTPIRPGWPSPDSSPRRPRWFRRVLDQGVARLARLLLHVFFREVQVTGLHHIPAGVPLVFVANHNNSVVDSVLLLALPGVCPRMLAKSTLFSHPVMAPLLTLIGALPVYRRQDASAEVARNFETFARCRQVLAGGGQIALFPEGRSHSESRRPPLKSGAARIVLDAGPQGLPGVRIVPVGLNYEAKDRFRSRVRVCVGQGVDPAAERALHGEEPRAAVRALTERIATALDRVTPSVAWPPPEKREAPRPSWRGLGGGVLALPILVLGTALNWVPYRIPGWISDGLSTNPDDPATYKLLAGLLIFPLAWLLEAAFAAGVAGPAWALIVTVLAPASGYAVLRLRERQPR